MAQYNLSDYVQRINNLIANARSIKREVEIKEEKSPKKVRYSDSIANELNLTVDAVKEDVPEVTALDKRSDVSEVANSGLNTTRDGRVIAATNPTVEPMKTTEEVDIGQSQEDEEGKKFKISQYEEMCAKLKPLLEVLIVKGSFANADDKSIIIKELWRYCGHRIGSIEMMSQTLTPFNLLADQPIVDLCLRNCSKLKCLRLSYCEVDLNVFRQLKTLKYLSCLHLEHIYGVESAEEWTQVGKILAHKLNNFSFASDIRRQDLSGMLSALGVYGQLALEEYNNDMRQLFASIYPNVYKLSLVNYYNIDTIAVNTLADRLSSLKELTLTYDKFHSRRANTRQVFHAICEQMPYLKKLSMKLITTTEMRPLFKLTNLEQLSLQFSVQKFVDFPSVYHLETLRHLHLTKVTLTPRRVVSMSRAFPYLLCLSLTGCVDRNHIDSAVFCCECRKDKTLDTCPLCYQNCFIGLLEFTSLARLELNYVNTKALMSTALPYIPSLTHLVINPFECLCGRSLLLSAMKIADMRCFTLVIRKCFIEEALKVKSRLPNNLEIIDYDKNDNDCDIFH